MLLFTLLGQVMVSNGDVPLNQFRSQKELALLVYLAHNGKTYQREFIAELLWESSSTKQALSNLRTILARIRKQIGDDALVVTRKSVTLAADQLRPVDSAQLLESLATFKLVENAEDAARLQQVLGWYTGDFLSDFTLSKAADFNEWMMLTREHIRRQALAGYEKLGAYAADVDPDFGISVARDWLGVDPLDEAAHTLLIRKLIEAGSQKEATAQYKYAVELLQNELGVEPPAEMSALIQAVQPTRASIPTTPDRVRHNLPAEHDRFFGRETDIEEIHGRLNQPNCRLVTLVGQGGMGKTRLATHIAWKRLGRHPCLLYTSPSPRDS